jgi:hypothetical protein
MGTLAHLHYAQTHLHYAQMRARVPILLVTKTFILDIQYRRGIPETLGAFRYVFSTMISNSRAH